jgi:hypothetical protein
LYHLNSMVSYLTLSLRTIMVIVGVSLELELEALLRERTPCNR